MSEQLDLRDATIARLKQERLWAEQELSVYRLASERAIYDASQFDASLFLSGDRGVEDVMRRVLGELDAARREVLQLQARLAEYEGADKRWHSLETVQALAKERDALSRECDALHREIATLRAALSAHRVEGEIVEPERGLVQR